MLIDISYIKIEKKEKKQYWAQKNLPENSDFLIFTISGKMDDTYFVTYTKKNNLVDLDTILKGL